MMANSGPDRGGRQLAIERLTRPLGSNGTVNRLKDRKRFGNTFVFLNRPVRQGQEPYKTGHSGTNNWFDESERLRGRKSG